MNEMTIKEISRKVTYIYNLKSVITSIIDNSDLDTLDTIKMLRELANMYESELNLGLNRK